MDQFLNRAAGGDAFGLAEVIVALMLSFVLCLMIAYFYRQSHRGLSYSVSFVHTMILLGVTVSVIMLIIGSNIARAFTLWALSRSFGFVTRLRIREMSPSSLLPWR